MSKLSNTSWFKLKVFCEVKVPWYCCCEYKSLHSCVAWRKNSSIGNWYIPWDVNNTQIWCKLLRLLSYSTSTLNTETYTFKSLIYDNIIKCIIFSVLKFIRYIFCCDCLFNCQMHLYLCCRWIYYRHWHYYIAGFMAWKQTLLLVRSWP